MSIFEKGRWYQGQMSIFEKGRWYQGQMSILVAHFA
jgi:hypothetical protein